MPDYSKCMIYKLCCKDTTISDIYIGSTCNFYRRKAQHKFSCNNENDKRHHLQVYKFIREHGGFQNWEMIMIQEKAVENKLEKEKLEREFIELLKPTLNCFIPTRTNKEYREQNKEEISKKKKEKFTCECGLTITKSSKARHFRSQKHQDFINQQK